MYPAPPPNYMQLEVISIYTLKYNIFLEMVSKNQLTMSEVQVE